ncbi:MAG TPA: 1-(5-phosphoribosyl)-5-[(5-phosphoribosylamino)methylideneamino] imidazole-4-carboxamide isomerase [Nitrospiria bacterium]|jgi:phosphoribosylformimino-5-aminoimidazole carboxamide ribotide isomerase|nr:1-(5-phosphoribosyl)-5-[(5-phosphoribosylamino)methylideneamino] imidazole-4-carboxamide isomerase [Nitrospiria bacterium]
MIVIPAMDLLEREVVRLEQGDIRNPTVYSGDPSEIVQSFVSHGASRIHLVDLNAAVLSDPVTNAPIIDGLLHQAGESIAFQVAGGIRNTSFAASLLARGASSIVLGSIAYSEPEGAKEILSSLGPSHVILALDYDRSGCVRTRGWGKSENEKVETAFHRFFDLGFRQFLFTSIDRDGLMTGPDLETLARLKKVASSNSKIIGSGGVASIEDIANLRKLDLDGVVVGKAIYENSIPLSILGEES